jgi:hypothetical protein
MVMIIADYTMKKIAQGFLPGLGVASYLDRKAAALFSPQAPQGEQPQEHPQQAPQQPRQAPRNEINRFWFTRSPKDTAPRSVILAEDEDSHAADLVLLFRNPVVVLTEQQVNGKFGTGAIGAEAEEFAGDFTKNMGPLSRKYGSIGALLSLYSLLDVMLHLRVVGKMDPPEMGFWLHKLKTKSKGPPASVPSLWRYAWSAQDNTLRELYVTGGVRMPLSLEQKAVKIELADGLVPRITHAVDRRAGEAVVP